LKFFLHRLLLSILFLLFSPESGGDLRGFLIELVGEFALLYFLLDEFRSCGREFVGARCDRDNGFLVLLAFPRYSLRSINWFLV